MTRNNLLRELIKLCLRDKIEAFTDKVVLNGKIYYTNFSFREVKK